jgi:predicted GIY-YIG superfamily endonuclease
MRAETTQSPDALVSEAKRRRGIGEKGTVGMEESLIVLKEEEEAHPLANSRCYVYVAVTRDGWFYVGETDNLRRRVADHRKGSVLGGKGVAFVCLDVPFGGKSMARRVEAAVIRRLWHDGFPLVSLKDAAHLHFADQ